MPTAVVLSHNWIAHELGHLEPWLDRHDFAVTRIFREDKSALPTADLLVVLGSPFSVAGPNCPPASSAEVAAVREWLKQGRPYLGICFGAQVLATATGGAVAALDQPFSGYVPIDTETGAPASLAGPWVVWHNDGITAPTDSMLLGSLDHADLAFSTGRAWGIQPHIEVTPDVLRRMLRALDTAESESAPIVEALEKDDSNANRAAQLLDAFLANVSSRVRVDLPGTD